MPCYQTPEGQSRGDECAEVTPPRNSQPPGRPLRHGGGRDSNSAEGAPTGRSADEAHETSTEGTARPFCTADAAPVRQNMVEAAVGDNPGEAPPRPANWDQMTRRQRKTGSSIIATETRELVLQPTLVGFVQVN